MRRVLVSNIRFINVTLRMHESSFDEHGQPRKLDWPVKVKPEMGSELFDNQIKQLIVSYLYNECVLSFDLKPINIPNIVVQNNIPNYFMDYDEFIAGPNEDYMVLYINKIDFKDALYVVDIDDKYFKYLTSDKEVETALKTETFNYLVNYVTPEIEYSLDKRKIFKANK